MTYLEKSFKTQNWKKIVVSYMLMILGQVGY